MATQITMDPPGEGEPLVAVRVYMYPKQRQRLRQEAARRGMAMSEYIKYLIEVHHRGMLED